MLATRKSLQLLKRCVALWNAYAWAQCFYVSILVVLGIFTWELQAADALPLSYLI